MSLASARNFMPILWVFLVASSASGQTASTPSVNPPGYNGARESIDGAHIPAIPSAPFSAKAELGTVQTLTDGGTISHRTFNIIARDFRGRTHNEFREWSSAAAPTEAKLIYTVIYDPATRIRTYLYPSSHLAMQYELPAANASSTVSPASTSNKNPLAPTVQKEDLGEKFEDSLRLTGLRETRTYPVGSIGNDKPMAVANEYWYSPDLRINVSVKRSDPRFGAQTVELTGLKREEPDAALFEIPSDYTIVNESGTTPGTASSSALNYSGGGAESADRVSMGGVVQAAKLITRVTPEYPELARASGISGLVRLHAIIAKDGSIANLDLVSGHPLLVKSSLDAVKQWRYEPTLINGKPVEVDTTIDVIYAFNHPAPPPTEQKP